MKIECQVYKKNGMPLESPEVHEVESYHCAHGSCGVYLKNGGYITLTDARLNHSNSIDHAGFVMGVAVHGIESCPDLHGAGVSQELWIRVRE